MVQFKKKLTYITLATALTAFQVQAQQPQDQTGLFLGAKQGNVAFDSPTGFDVDDDKLFTWVLGLDFGNGFTIELEKGEADLTVEDTVNSVSEDLSFETKAAYITYRSESKYFWKAKGGYLQQEASAASLNAVEYDESGFSWGGGLGVRVTNLLFELEYQELLEDADIITFGIHMYY